MFITESWFWRGTQSAFFYYASCAPYVDYKYKQKRRREAAQAEKEKAEIITTQPGMIVQPGPFQTNPDWAEEIIMGPGPPKGWKKEKILQKYSERARELYRKNVELEKLPDLDPTTNETGLEGSKDSEHSTTAKTAAAITIVESVPNMSVHQTNDGTTDGPGLSSSSSKAKTDTTSDSSSSDEAEQNTKSRPSMERRLSSAVGNLKDTIKGWNWKRYERDDEILSGLNERFNKLWDKATSYGVTDATSSSKIAAFASGRKRAATNDSERYDWQRAVRNPEINDMHPPTVSKLPATRDAAAWMLLPPPSAAVMEGKIRPQEEPALRWPLAQIHRTTEEWSQITEERELARSRISESTLETLDSRKTPDLSNSSSDETWSDGEAEDESNAGDYHKRYSAPVAGWMPVIPKRSAKPLHSTSQYFRADEAWRERRVW